jgi:hypothetical protein
MLRRIFMKRISVILITVALIVGMWGYVSSNVGGSESYTLTIDSTGGGSVTEPGEGTLAYDQGTVVNLTAEADEGYRFVNWSGDVYTIANMNAATTTITMEDDYSITASFTRIETGRVGIKAGDWIKLEYSYVPAQLTYPEWFKVEFTNIEGTIVTVRFTQHMSDGTEQSDTVSVDIVYGIEVYEIAAIAIPANRTIGDPVYMADYGIVTIEGETTKTYAGGNRTVVCANFTQNETRVTYCWDKLTGVMVEVSSTSPGFTATASATETNMWESAEVTTTRMPWWPWIIVGVVAVGLVIFFVRKRRAA